MIKSKKLSAKLAGSALIPARGGRVRLSGIYRVYLGRRQGLKIWLVDGARVCRELYADFIMGGNEQRYRFNPPGDIWLDNRIGVEELEYTLAHELIEVRLMREHGWTYSRAHTEGGLALEKRLRARDARLVARRQARLFEGGAGKLAGLDGSPVDLSVLAGVYRQYFGRVQGLSVWIVDGPKVRRDLNPDFCFATHDLESRFVPEGEIWLDSAMSCEEAFFSLRQQLQERKLLDGGVDYDTAYDRVQAEMLRERDTQEKRARRHEARLAPVRRGVRERGVRAGKRA